MLIFKQAVATHDDEPGLHKLPWDFPKIGRGRKAGDARKLRLLKLHGCVEHPDSIVRTRPLQVA